VPVVSVRFGFGDDLFYLSLKFMCKWDAGVFCLQTVKRAAGFWTAQKCRAGIFSVGVRIIALRIIPGAAVSAAAAGNRGRDYYAVSDLEVAHFLPDFLDNANAFVAQDSTGTISGAVPRTRCKSVPQIALAVRRTMAS